MLISRRKVANRYKQFKTHKPMTIFRATILTLLLFISVRTFGQKGNDTTQYSKFVALTEINRLETKYPAINGTTVDAKVITDLDLKGNIVVINIWSKDCLPCLYEIPGLDSLARQYKHQGVTFIAISYELEDFIKDKYISQNKFSYDHLTFPKDTVMYKYFGFGYPLNIVLDTNGVVKYFKYGGLANPSGADIAYNDIKSIIDKLRK